MSRFLLIFTKILGGKRELYWRNQIDRAEKMLDLGLDPVFNIWLPDYQASPEVEVKTWREKKGDETLLTKEFHTPAGVLRQVVREDDEWCRARHGAWIPKTWGGVDRDHFGMDLFDDYNISRRLEPWVKDRSDLEKLKYIIRIPRAVDVLNQNNGLVLSSYIFQEVPYQGVMMFIEAWKHVSGLK